MTTSDKSTDKRPSQGLLVSLEQFEHRRASIKPAAHPLLRWFTNLSQISPVRHRQNGANGPEGVIRPQDEAQASSESVVDSFGSSGSRTNDCPGFGTLTAFVEHRLGGTARDAVVSHLAQCEACYFAVTEAASAGPLVSHHGMWRWQTRVMLASAAALTLAVAMTLPVTWHYSRQTATERTSLASLTTIAVAEGAGSPLATPADGSKEHQQKSVDEALAKAVAAYQATLQQTGGTKVRAAYVPANVLNERAAFQLAQWQQTRRPEDALAAFNAAQSAVADDPRMIEARFNLALALEAVSASFREASLGAWEDYMAIESTSSRASEAQRRLRALKAMNISERTYVDAIAGISPKHCGPTKC